MKRIQYFGEQLFQSAQCIQMIYNGLHYNFPCTLYKLQTAETDFEIISHEENIDNINKLI